MNILSLTAGYTKRKERDRTEKVVTRGPFFARPLGTPGQIEVRAEGKRSFCQEDLGDT